MSTITFLVPGHLETGATRGGAAVGGGNADDWAGFDVTTVRVGLARSGAPTQRLEATLGTTNMRSVRSRRRRIRPRSRKAWPCGHRSRL